MDMVNHPPHYSAVPAKCNACGHPIECIDVAQHFGFSLGNSLKYIWRAGAKGSHLEDLKKSAWYLNQEISRLEAELKEANDKEEKRRNSEATAQAIGGVDR
jgi:hypothetical protein